MELQKMETQSLLPNGEISTTNDPYVCTLKFICPICKNKYVAFKSKYCANCGNKLDWERWTRNRVWTSR